MTSKISRIYLLGAGFSTPAGLPTGPELWREVLKDISGRDGRAGKFDRDLELYLRFKKERYGQIVSEHSVDFEDFLSFLDIEHYLGLRGGDTWSDDGNESQILVKRAIGRIIHERTPRPEQLPSFYFDFASLLTEHDLVLTFNYDVVLETLLDHVGIQFRRFADRYSEVNDLYGSIDTDSPDELVLFKLHGSVDWVNRESYKEGIKHWQRHDPHTLPRHPVFGPDRLINTTPLLEGPQLRDDPLINMHRIVDGLDTFYFQLNDFIAVPWLLAPSRAKAVYANALRSFWHGMGQAGILNYGLTVIGYSLPDHDDYVSQLLFRMARNYQDNYWNKEFMWEGERKPKIFVVDKQNFLSGRSFKKKYSFFYPEKTIFHLTGLNAKAVDAFRKVINEN